MAQCASADGIATGVGNLNDGFRSQLHSGLSFTYDTTGSAPVLTLTDSRVSSDDALAALKVLFGPGGAAESEFDAIIADDTDANEDAILVAVSNTSPEYIFDLGDSDFIGDGRGFIVRTIVFSAIDNTGTLTGDGIDGDTAAGLSLAGETDGFSDPMTSINYTAP